jgi:pimeloyl-ACP methyl ester carboxylesterase
MVRTSFVAALALTAVAGCKGGKSESSAASVTTVNGADLYLETPPAKGSVETVDVASDRAALVVVGEGDAAKRPIVSLHGTCVVARQDIENWASAARAYGTVVALEGDTACAGGVGGRTWHTDAATLDKRIDAALDAVRTVRGVSLDKEVVLVGDDSGAPLALALAAQAPSKYTRVVLVELPDVAPAFDLSAAHAIAVLASDHDSVDKPQRSVEMFEQAKIATKLFTLSGATHGDLGIGGAHTIGEALAFVTQH